MDIRNWITIMLALNLLVLAVSLLKEVDKTSGLRSEVVTLELDLAECKR